MTDTEASVLRELTERPRQHAAGIAKALRMSVRDVGKAVDNLRLVHKRIAIVSLTHEEHSRYGYNMAPEHYAPRT